MTDSSDAEISDWDTVVDYDSGSYSEDDGYGLDDPIPAPNFGTALSSSPATPCHQDPPPMSSSGPIRSSPIVGNHQERQELRRQKGFRERVRTLEKKKRDQAEKRADERTDSLAALLAFMEEKKLRLWDLMDYLFNPEYGQGAIRYHQFFSTRGNATQILNWWTSAENRSQRVRQEISEWAEAHVAKKIAKEARTITKEKALQTMHKRIDADFVRSFKLPLIYEMLKTETARTSMRMLEALATGTRVSTHTEHRHQRKKTVVTAAALACLGEYSHANNLAKRLIGIYLYASGAQRQTISVISSLGLSESYTNLVTRNKRRRPKGKQGPLISAYTGTLHQLSESMRLKAREIAHSGLFKVVYDNININMRNAEQIIGCHDSQENGTCATLLPLIDAKIEDLDVEEFRAAFLEAPALTLDNVLHTAFKKFENNLNETQPSSLEKIPVPEHPTDLHPLPSWNIDESSIIGNAEVDQAIMKELGLDELPEAEGRVRFLAGDQLSLARLRALEIIRAGQESGYEGFFWGIWIPGLFHTKIADAHGTLLTHFGKPSTGTRNPGSLWFHNTRLDRLPITLTSLPSFRTCRDLIFVSLYARVLHCLLLVSNTDSLKDYSVKFDKWESLVLHARKIFAEYANSFTVEELREKRERCLRGQPEGKKPTAGDMVFENASLFLRDALISREFSDAVKAGDSGRIFLVLKAWALSFRGNGRTKYAYEMLHLLHHLTSVWKEKIRKIVMKNWLGNPSGLPNRFVELDLIQEHLNFLIKIAYKAKGSNASWDWLAIISPVIDMLRELAKNFNALLGSDQGTRHAPPDLSNDIQTLMESLDEHNVYRIQEGRTLDDDDIVKDVIAIGLQNLTTGIKNPLSEYNTAFRKLQKRRRTKPVSLSTLQLHHPKNHPQQDPTATSVPTMESAQRDESSEEDESDEETGELDRILDGEDSDELTLPRLALEDVALDMDEVEVEVEEEEEEEDSGWESMSDEGEE